jgi:hypothetical protein
MLTNMIQWDTGIEWIRHRKKATNSGAWYLGGCHTEVFAGHDYRLVLRVGYKY